VKPNPLTSVLKFMQYILTNRIHFPKERIGEKLILDDGLEWHITMDI